MPGRPGSNIHSLPLADSAKRIRHVFVHNLLLEARIGVHPHEKIGRQKIRLNLDLSVYEEDSPHDDQLRGVVCYEKVVKNVKALLAEGHINLVETLAERIADVCLLNRRVHLARVRVEKLEAMGEAESVGVEIERRSPLA